LTVLSGLTWLSEPPLALTVLSGLAWLSELPLALAAGWDGDVALACAAALAFASAAA
jgi:hypothetical protein